MSIPTDHGDFRRPLDRLKASHGVRGNGAYEEGKIPAAWSRPKGSRDDSAHSFASAAVVSMLLDLAGADCVDVSAR